MVLFNCGVVCFVGASLGLGTCYNPLIQTSMAICRLNLILTTHELGVMCAMCFSHCGGLSSHLGCVPM